MATAEKEREGFRERPLAPESLKTRRAREKLLKVWEAEKEQFTPKAIEETVDKIHKWIADNAKHRVPIKEKSIKLFNQNQNAALISKKVQQIADKVKVDMLQFASTRSGG
jgi:hypothetical protein